MDEMYQNNRLNASQERFEHATHKPEEDKRFDELHRNPRTNLLERSEFNYTLQDVEHPNLYRMMYNYDEIPKIIFNGRVVPQGMPEEIWITDTTFRDGQQSREPYTVEQIVKLYDMLHRLGGEKGIVRQSEFFVYSEKDREAVRKCMELGYQFPEITTWIRATKKDFDIAQEIGVKETGILVSCSDYHVFSKLRMTRREAIDHYISIVRQCIDAGIRPRCHFEDITRADFYGFVVPFVSELSQLMRDTDVPIKIRACDTMGYGVAIPGASLPRSVPGIIYGLRYHARVPSQLIEWHGHNDFYGSVTNAMAAWIYGASGVNCSLLGIGERTGNTPLEAMVFQYAQLRGTLDGMDPHVITEIADYYRTTLDYDIPPRTPFIGSSFNVTRAGVHADGLLKNEEIYNVFNTEKILNRPARVVIGETSGAAGIAHWIRSYFELSPEDAPDKNTKLVAMVKAWVDEQYAGGRAIAISDGELAARVLAVANKLGVRLPRRPED